MCVLLVEDEGLVREVLAEVLVEAGQEVCTATDGDTAVCIIEDPPNPFTLLVTDLHLPGTRDGFEVAALMRQLHPHVPTIFITGRPDLFRQLPTEDSEVLAKPFALAEFMQAVERVLGTA